MKVNISRVHGAGSFSGDYDSNESLATGDCELLSREEFNKLNIKDKKLRRSLYDEFKTMKELQDEIAGLAIRNEELGFTIECLEAELDSLNDLYLELRSQR